MEEGPVILFDGVCNYCNRMINFVIRQDRKGVLRFAPLQSPAGQRLLERFGISVSQDFGSFVLIEGGKAYQKSTAALRVMNHLPWYWKEVQLLKIVPRPFRDAIYDYIARNRYRWFGRSEQCMVPTPEVRSRFLQ